MKAFTYDDILMVPSYNHWESRKVVDISMKCKMGKLSLALPLMTANMETGLSGDHPCRMDGKFAAQDFMMRF